jgi:hypothetical protein
VEHWEADAELEGLQNSTTRVWDLVLGRPTGTSSLAMSMSLTAKLIEDCFNATVGNGVHWGPRSALATVVSHFP